MSNPVSHNTSKQRYEIHVDGVFAGFTVAEEAGGTVTLPHTVVFDAFEGQGLAGELVAGALDDIRAQGQNIVVTCPYITRFLEKHPEYTDLLA